MCGTISDIKLQCLLASAQVKYHTSGCVSAFQYWHHLWLFRIQTWVNFIPYV